MFRLPKQGPNRRSPGPRARLGLGVEQNAQHSAKRLRSSPEQLIADSKRGDVGAVFLESELADAPDRHV